MRRHLPRLVAALLLAVIPAALGTATALLYSAAGTALLGRLAGRELSTLFRGTFRVARVSGSFVHSVVLERVVIRDTLGAPFADLPRLTVHFALPNLLAGRFVFTDVTVDSPAVRVVKRANGRLNLHEIFRLGEGPGGGRSPLIELRELRLRNARVELRLPWSPPDTMRTPPQIAQALALDRARPGRVILETPDGLRRIVRLQGLTARLPVLRISSPDGSPLTFDVDSLATRISDPAITVVDLGAHAWTHGDSLAFTLHRARLPATEARGGGVVTWPKGPLQYDFALESPRFDLADFHWISRDFPEMTGHTLVVARSRSSTLTAYRLRELDASGPQGRITGAVTALVDSHRGLGVEDMALTLTDLDLDVPRPYLDTLPLHGRITGTLAGAGFLDGLDLNADVTFEDALVEGGATNRFRAAGHLVFGGPEGTLLDPLNVDSADLDLRTVQLLAPAVTLRGRMELSGSLQGPWHNVTYTGAMIHRDGDLPASHADGIARLDTRSDTVQFDTRVRVEPLAFDGIRPGYPGIPLQGAVTGTVVLRGSVDHFFVNTAVQGQLGAIALHGTITNVPGRFVAESLGARFTALDLSKIRPGSPRTSLAGRLSADGTVDSAAGPSGFLALDLGRGTVAELGFDSLHAVARGADGRVVVDTATLQWPAGTLGGSGALAWRVPGDQQLSFSFQADSLGALDTLVTRFAGPAADTAEAAPLAGRAHGDLTVLGSVAEPRILVNATGEDLVWRALRTPELSVGFGWNGTRRPELGIGVRADSMIVSGVGAREVSLVAGGYQDSLRWTAAAGVGTGVRLAAGGEWWATGPQPQATVDSLVAALPERTWRLARPVTMVLDSGWIGLDSLALEAGDGSGSLLLAGSVPGAKAGDLTIHALGIDLRDVYALLRRDTTGVAGTVQLDLEVGGTAAAPTLRGSGSVSDLSFGDFGSPFVQGIFAYGDRRLDANLLMWKTGQPVLRVEAQLPLDLALQATPRRQVPGPLSVRALADSTDLAVAEAFTRNLRRVRGTLRADVEVGGTWEAPRLDGFIELRDASAMVPGLGVAYDRANLRARLSGDSIAIDSLVVRSGVGTLRAGGGLRLEQLTRPVLDLTLRARRFRAIDVKRFLTLDASGTARLTGPVFHPHLTGRITADEGNLHFADLITKRIVDLENPGDSGLIDLDLVRTERLGANFQNRFVDSLTIDTLQIQMGESFWLRSSEANIQLDGALTVNKVRSQYRFDGTLNAVRGSYTLRIGGFVTREFTVERGTVRYFGTPDLNADLDIEARHVVIAAETSEEIPVTARITGTMLQPKLELLSSPTPNRPALSQTEVVSYLMFNRPTFSLQGQNGQGGQYAAVEAGLSYLSSALSSEIQRSLISDLGVPIDYLDIRPGGAGAAGIAGQSGTAQVATVAAGWQIGRRWFVTLVADLCTNTQRFYPNAEFRMTRQIRLKTSVEPAYSCQVALSQPVSVNKYQVGLDVLWEREY